MIVTLPELPLDMDAGAGVSDGDGDGVGGVRLGSGGVYGVRVGDLGVVRLGWSVFAFGFCVAALARGLGLDGGVLDGVLGDLAVDVLPPVCVVVVVPVVCAVAPPEVLPFRDLRWRLRLAFGVADSDCVSSVPADVDVSEPVFAVVVSVLASGFVVVVPVVVAMPVAVPVAVAGVRVVTWKAMAIDLRIESMRGGGTSTPAVVAAATIAVVAASAIALAIARRLRAAMWAATCGAIVGRVHHVVIARTASAVAAITRITS